MNPVTCGEWCALGQQLPGVGNHRRGNICHGDFKTANFHTAPGQANELVHIFLMRSQQWDALLLQDRNIGAHQIVPDRKIEWITGKGCLDLACSRQLKAPEVTILDVVDEIRSGLGIRMEIVPG